MTTTLHKLAPTQVQLDIEVSESDLAKARERTVRDLGRRLRIPGFRPGHIPPRIVEQHVGAEHIEHEALEAVVPDAYTKALEEHALDPVEQPKINLERVSDGRALKITATVAVKPEIILGTYTGLKVTKPAADVADDEVEKSIEALRRRAASLEPVTERGIALGDVVTLDYVGRIDGAEFEGGSATGHTTEIAPDRFVPGFAEQLYGARSDERRSVAVTFPAQYQPESLAGKTATFDVHVRDVKVPVLPAVDDAFAREVSGLETLDALRNEVRRRLERGAEAQAREVMEAELIGTLLRSHDFPLPEVLVERETQSILDDIKRQVGASGTDWQSYLAARKQTEEQLTAQVRADAQPRVKSALLLEAIAKAENIRAGSADVDREIGRIAQATGRTPQAVFDALRQSDGIGRLLNAIKRNKALAFLVDKADVSASPASAQVVPERSSGAPEAPAKA